MWTIEKGDDLSGKTVIITGASSGIGKETAIALANAGAHVVLAVRNPQKGLAAANYCAGIPQVEKLNLADLSSVHDFARRWGAQPVHYLINNAGIMATPTKRTTAEGYELQFGTNHLGHMALTGLLMPALCAGNARVVSVSSIAHWAGNSQVLHADNPAQYDPSFAYANSKLANLLFANRLHVLSTRHDWPISVAAAHPGVSTTGLISSPDGLGSTWKAKIATPFFNVFGHSPVEAAQSLLYAALAAPAGSYTGPTGFREMRGPLGTARQSKYARNQRLAASLWSLSQKLTGVDFSRA